MMRTSPLARMATALLAGLVAWTWSSAAETPRPEPAPPTRHSIAVLYFQNNALMNREALAPLEKGLADMFITELSQIQALRIVERVQLQSLMTEMGLGASGAVEASTAQQMGKLLGAQTLLLGSFSTDMRGDRMRIDIRIVETETGLTLKAEEMTDKVNSLFKMVQRLTTRIANDLRIQLTREDRGRLERPVNESFAAAVRYAEGLDLEDEGDLPGALEKYRAALAINPQYGQARQRIAELEQSTQQE